MSEFERVASLADLPPGSMLGVWVGDDAVLLANVDGEVMAIGDICSHAHAHLSDGFLDGEQVECPLHGARFHLRTGRNLCLPAVVPVKHYEVRLEGDEIWVSSG